MNLITIRDVLSFPENNPGTWFYLPPDKTQWNLETMGVFSLDSADFPLDSDDDILEQAKNDGWVEVLDGASIEDIIINAKEQFDTPSLEQLFDAFIFYYENDTFLEF